MFKWVSTRVTSSDISMLTIRLVAGTVLIAHGAQQVFGAFGGGGLNAAMSKYGPGGGGVFGLLVAIGLFFGGVGIMTGILARFSAAANVVIMLGAIFMVHAPNGFFLVDSFYKYLGGFEYNLTIIGLCLAVLIAGPGKLSLSRFIPAPKVAALRNRRISLVLE